MSGPVNPAPGRHIRRVLADRPAGDNRQKMWASMRVLASWTNSHIATVTEAPEASIRRYVVRLAAAGYLREVGKQNAGKKREKVWRLVRNTGPKAPRASIHGVTDLNNGKTYDVSGAEVKVVRRSDYYGVGGRSRARADGVNRQ